MEDKIKHIFEEVLSIKIDDYSELTEVDVDSLDLISIFFKLESELGIKISNDDVTEYQLTTVENLLKYLSTMKDK